MNAYVQSIGLLASSAFVMTVAWYAHLRHPSASLWKVILASWGLAFFEYCLMIPGNRIGHSVMPAATLRIVSEFFTLTAFVLFSVLYLKEPFTTNHFVSFALVLAAVYVAVAGPFK